MKKYTLPVIAFLVVLGAMMLIMLPAAESPEPQKTMALSTTKNSLTVLPVKENTIASAWQWDVLDAKPEPTGVTESINETQANRGSNMANMPFTQESVYKALHAVKLDDNNDVILDDDALNALNATFEQSDIQLDAEALTELQELIRRALPGSAGEQTAQVVADYYQYLGAKSEFNSLYEANPSGQTIGDYETQYTELVALRELYLGAEVADQLFATSNANSRYMFESMKLEMNEHLSEEEKKAAQASIVERHTESTTQVNNWNERYQAFLADKQFVLNASVSEEEKRDQLTGLMHEHFSVEELEYVSHLQLDSL